MNLNEPLVKKRIEKLTNKEHNVNAEGFLRAIQNGADPITGEVLAPDSIYLHPKFLEDIKLFFKKLTNWTGSHECRNSAG